ncbi:MAG: hypothetical protein JWO03_3750 [Bacteroidetes bacterium]|nr:hypothetical protein [Bacteroidota bacterium]
MIIAALLVLTSCKSLQPFQLSFGSGGGFTAVVTTYTVAEDGKVYKSSSSFLGQKLVTTLDKKQLKEIEALIAKVNFPNSAAVNKPGNMTYFLNLTKDGKVYQNNWSANTSGNTALDELSQKLNSFIPKQQ